MKIPTIQEIDWRKEYQLKKQLFDERNYQEVDPFTFYRDLFPAHTLSEQKDDGKGNAIGIQVRHGQPVRSKRWVIGDDLCLLNKVIGDEFGLIYPISFFGRKSTKKYAHELFSLAIDVDYVDLQRLKNLLKQCGNGVQLKPNYLVHSGKGMHLYYFLKKPLELYHHREVLLTQLKHALIDRLWADTTSLRSDKPDIAGIYQGFRAVGSQSKLGKEYPVRAYKLTDKRYNLYEINKIVEYEKIDLDPIFQPKKTKSKHTLEQAKRLYPEWYQRRIVKGEPNKKIKNQGTWTCKKDLYNWWLREITKKAEQGGRYFCIMALCSYGLKCGIPEYKIKKDAYSLLDTLEERTEDNDNHFLRSDITDALKALKGDNKRLSTIATRKWISDHTKIEIPPTHRPKSKRLKQKDHLELARTAQRLRDPAGEWRNKNGRPKLNWVVEIWRLEHPNGSKAECIRDLGMSPKTVYKWWNG